MYDVWLAMMYGTKGRREPARASGYFMAPGPGRFPKHFRQSFIKYCRPRTSSPATPAHPPVTKVLVVYDKPYLFRNMASKDGNLQLCRSSCAALGIKRFDTDRKWYAVWTGRSSQSKKCNQDTDDKQICQ